MDFDFSDPIQLVQKKKKYSDFHITPIGGPDEIVAWRAQQEAKEYLRRVNLVAREERLKEFEAAVGAPVAVPTIHTTSWQEKQAFVKSERERLAIMEEVALNPPWKFYSEPPKSFSQRIVEFIKYLWNGKL